MEEKELLELQNLRKKYNAKQYMQALCNEIAAMVDDTLSTFPIIDGNVVNKVLEMYMDEIEICVWKNLTWAITGVDWRDD